MRPRKTSECGAALAGSQRDPKKFEAFCVAVEPSLVQFFARRMPDVQVALDLCADTLVRAFEKRHDFRGNTDEQALGWLFKIGRRTLEMYRRREKVEQTGLRRLSLRLTATAPDELQRIEDLAIAEQIGPVIDRLCAELPDPYREAVRLHVVEELSYEEIAERLHISNGAVRTRFSRGLRMLTEGAEDIGLELGCDG
jgi:RNA polymerase sigma-70 factor, ECF subfamily